MTTAMRPYPDPSDSLDVALWAAEKAAAQDAADLAAEARRLAQFGSSVTGPAFDVLCANLHASRRTAAVLRQLISERTAS